MARERYGFKGVLLYNSATPAEPTWVAMPKIKDVILNIEADKHEATTRGLAGFKGYLPTLIDLGVETEMNYTKQDSGALETILAMLKSRFFGRDIIELLVLDGPLAPKSEGIRMEAALFKFPREEPLGGNMVVKLDFATHAEASAPPSWYVHPDA